MTTLSVSGIVGLYSYRGLVKSLDQRVREVPLAADLSQRVSGMQLSLAYTSELRDLSRGAGGQLPYSAHLAREEFRHHREGLRQTLAQFRSLLNSNQKYGSRLGGLQHQRNTLDQIEVVLARIEVLDQDEGWLLDRTQARSLKLELDELQLLCAELPAFLHKNITRFVDEVRTHYRWLIVVSWIASTLALISLLLFVRLFYQWVFHPLRVLVRGSRRVARGDFDHRISLDTQDEMAELADAMNDMTSRFQGICLDLDRQVQQRTREVVRSEQMASVGYLAAGVAHEINNPLASIAMCAESLEGRLATALSGTDSNGEVVGKYLRMIQQEAFRCKEITEQLLDFSRLGDVRRCPTRLGELIQGVIDMVAHLGKYQSKHIQFETDPSVVVMSNPQELKQVVLNLLANGLDSVRPGGTVQVRLSQTAGQAEMVVRDDGCGMTPEVLEHLFEPFFTRKRDGQGTGLGLSITYRIVQDHDGSIEAESQGTGQGACFRVRLPLARPAEKELNNHCQAA
jgi:signal transduction histidine kinase